MNDEKKNVLHVKIPKGVTADGPVMNAQEASFNAMLAIPQTLLMINETLEAICDHLSVISLYAEKKGLSEMLFTDDELTGGGLEDGNNKAD